MKGKIIPILLVVSLLANGILGYTLVHQRNQEEALEKGEAIREITFAVQRLEGCQKDWDTSEYTVAVAHLYAVCDHVQSLHNVDYWVTTEPFQTLWNVAAAYPEVMQANINEVIAALSKLNTEECLTDEEIMGEFKAFTDDFRIKAAELSSTGTTPEDRVS